MVVAVYYQFGLGAVALLLRFIDKPCRRCAHSCLSCFGRCARRCGLGKKGCCTPLLQKLSPVLTSCPCKLVAALLFSVLWVLAKWRLRWYWFHLAMQVGFLYREMQIIAYYHEHEGVMHWEVIAAHTSMWLALLLVCSECWRYSTVRDSKRSAEAIDQVLDMVLLPVNYGFFCSLCVRILKLQGNHQAREMVNALLESADIWEAWALWSVLGLFVRVVEFNASQDANRRHDVDYQRFITHFKGLSLQGVKLWVMILFVTIVFNVMMEGVVSILAPTWCFHTYNACQTCEEWYSANYKLAASSVLYILCCFALVFVFTFERVFQEYLHDIKPVWKFWGVKGVVSVTYFQYLVLNYGLRLGPADATLWHCLLCCIEMPLLSILHSTKAYPCREGEEWVAELLKTCQRKELEEEGDLSLKDALSDVSAGAAAAGEEVLGRELSPAGPSGEGEGDEPRQVELLPRGFGADGGEEESAREIGDGAHPSANIRRRVSGGSFSERAPEVGSTATHIMLWLISCYFSVRFILWLVPLERDLEEVSPIWNFTCAQEGSLETFIRERKDTSHWLLPDATLSQWRTGLPLCSTALLACDRGFSGNVSVKCGSDGHYQPIASCVASACGKPPDLPHAAVSFADKAIYEFTQGVKISYVCNTGYLGNPIAECGKEAIGFYTVEGNCSEVVCGRPPAVDDANPLTSGEADIFRMGQVVHYQCLTDYVGSPTANCTAEGRYLILGDRCMKSCGTPPTLEHAIPDYGTDVARRGFVEGVKIQYQCSPGFGGGIAAICGSDGKYQVSGHCEAVCGHPVDFRHAKPVLPENDTHHWKVGRRVPYQCEPGYEGNPVAECGSDGNWILANLSECVYTGCSDVGAYLTTVLGDKWQDHVAQTSAMNTTAESANDVLVFMCKGGLVGQPITTCLKGQWNLTGTCEQASTTLGCKCKRDWYACSGAFKKDCRLWHGCDLRASGRYGYCEVEESSCPSVASSAWGVPPAWDYCTDGDASTSWAEQASVSGGASGAAWVGAVLPASLLLLAMLCTVVWLIKSPERWQAAARRPWTAGNRT